MCIFWTDCLATGNERWCLMNWKRESQYNTGNYVLLATVATDRHYVCAVGVNIWVYQIFPLPPWSEVVALCQSVWCEIIWLWSHYDHARLSWPSSPHHPNWMTFKNYEHSIIALCRLFSIGVNLCPTTAASITIRAQVAKWKVSHTREEGREREPHQDNRARIILGPASQERERERESLRPLPQADRPLWPLVFAASVAPFHQP